MIRSSLRTRRQNTPLRPLAARAAAVLLMLAGAFSASAAVPPGYQFRGLSDAIPASAFKTDYNNRVLGVASALNNNGAIFGFWLTNEDVFMSHSLLFANNPKMTVRDTDNFIALSGSDVGCRNFLGISLCSIEFPYGVRLTPAADPLAAPTSVSAFVNTPFDAVAVAASLPFMRYPGNFVNENASGVLASTQLSASSQFGVLVRGTTQVALADVPWLIDINDLAQPLALGYDGSDGGCHVYGTACVPVPTPCEHDDDHDDDEDDDNKRGNRGDEASGNAWGHNKCRDGVVDGNNGGGNDNEESSAVEAPVTRAAVVADPARGALLIRLLDDNGIERYRFPLSTPLGISSGRVTNLFPLAINSTRAILRGDVSVGSTVYEKRLLACVINPDALDADRDGIVDCVGGLQLLGGTAASIRVGTVLGFSLNNPGILVGNLGYNTAGSGTPFVLDVTAATPALALLGNLASGTDDWEINTITDLNNPGRMSGYGYRNCALTPEAFYLDPVSAAPASPLRFARGAFEFPALLPVGTRLPIAPTLSGGSGFYELRTHVKKPTDSDWQLLSDWSATVVRYDPGSYTGDVCFRIEARDMIEPGESLRTVVRYSVGTPGNGETVPDANTGTTAALRIAEGNFRIGELLGASGLPGLLLLALAGLWRRRSHARRC